MFPALILSRRFPAPFVPLLVLALPATAPATTLTNIAAGLPAVSYSAAAWGDYDGDGDLDLLLTGSGDSGPLSRVYRNDGGSFVDSGAGLTGVSRGSVAWGDFDADGDLDILLTGRGVSGDVAIVYRNMGADTFTDIGAGLPGVEESSVAWGDCDNDGDLDILLTGHDGTLGISRVYRNNGSGVFIDAGAPISGVFYSSAAWGDFDKDGDQDIVITGWDNSTGVTKLYRNNGAGFFTNLSTTMTGVYHSSVAFGDYDNDGDLDILLAGLDNSLNKIAKVYKNNGSGTFSDGAAGLPGVSNASAVWGDIDNDGDLDVLLSGSDLGAVRSTRVYLKPGSGVFTDLGAGLQGVDHGSVAMADYDNDGDLDVLVTGLGDSAGVASIYANSGTTPNAPPGMPTNLSANRAGSVVTFSWTSPVDDHTLPNGLSFNVRVGTTPGGNELVPSMADAVTGLRRVARLGNCQKTSVAMTVAPATFYWSVQAIDGSFAGSTFAPEKLYRPFLTDMHAGLAPVWNSSVDWGDYDNDGDLDLILTGSDGAADLTRLYRNVGLQMFSEVPTSLPGVSESSAMWGDYDRDGDLDLLITGQTSGGPISQVYRNDGSDTFVDIGAGLPGVYQSSAAWGDYDQDGDLDIALTGRTAGGPLSRIYRNDAGTFVDIGAGLPGVYHSSVAWGDYDRDSDLDLLVTGFDGSTAVTRLYRNDGGGVFTLIGTGIPDVAFSSVAWGDYDKDGDLDLLISGLNASSQKIARVYINTSGTFSLASASLGGVSSSSVAWGDFDNDGDLDIVETGIDNSAAVARLYRNDGSSFTSIDAGITAVYGSSIACGDFDGDGNLDLAVTGTTGSSLVANVYHNDTAPSNSPPSPPTALTSSRNSIHEATLSWSGATDDHTPVNGLSYNVRVGTTPGGTEILNTMADNSTGYRRVAKLGNAQCRNLLKVKVPIGTFYWSVQAIDGAFRGSAFSNEAIRTDQGFASIDAGMQGLSDGTVSYGDYDNDGDLDILYTGQNVSEKAKAGIERNDGGGVFTDIGAGFVGATFACGAWGDYDNDGDLDVLIAGQESLQNPSSARLYRNNGNGTFTDLHTALIKVHDAAAAWGDYDNDGDLDLVVEGFNDSLQTAITRLYRNDGSGIFVEVPTGFVNVYGGTLSWGDYDKDGDLDLLISGEQYPCCSVTRIFRNDSGTFTVSATPGPGAAAWSDYDNDGDLDFTCANRVYSNNGNGTFTPAAVVLPSADPVAWGDCDDDGDPDLALVTGNTSCRIYRNDSPSTFADMAAGLPSLSYGDLAWGDYDNDGDPDLLGEGTTATNSKLLTIFQSDGLPSNARPASPSNPAAVRNGNQVVFSWTAASDDHTPTAGLQYNVRVGTTPGGQQILSAMADPATGFRRVAAPGNAMDRLSLTLTLPTGVYYWAVQSIDEAYLGSAFSNESTYDEVSAVTDPRMPTAYALNPAMPNPFQRATTITYALPKTGPIAIRIFDISGRLVRVLAEGVEEAAFHSVGWNARDETGAPAPDGIYFIKLEGPGVELTRKIVLVR